MKNGAKKKKKQVKYVDDGRTIVDMSGVSGVRPLGGTPGTGKGAPRRTREGNTLKDQAKTYFSAVKKMFIPMLITMAAISVIFLLLYVVFSLAT